MHSDTSEPCDLDLLDPKSIPDLYGHRIKLGYPIQSFLTYRVERYD